MTLPLSYTRKLVVLRGFKPRSSAHRADVLSLNYKTIIVFASVEVRLLHATNCAATPLIGDSGPFHFIIRYLFRAKWYSVTGSNRRHSACKTDTLPAELTEHRSLTEHNECGGSLRRPQPMQARRAHISRSRNSKLFNFPDAIRKI